MVKKSRKERVANRRRSRRHGKGRPKGQVTKLPETGGAETTQGEGGEVPQPEKPKTKKRLDDKQALAAQLMQARTVINQKNVALANLNTEFTKQMAELRTENAQLRADAFQAQINAEVRENELTAKEHDLPDVAFQFAKDRKGWYIEYETPEVGEDEEEEEGEAEPEPEPPAKPEPKAKARKQTPKKEGAAPPVPADTPEPAPATP